MKEIVQRTTCDWVQTTKCHSSDTREVRIFTGNRILDPAGGPSSPEEIVFDLCEKHREEFLRRLKRGVFTLASEHPIRRESQKETL